MRSRKRPLALSIDGREAIVLADDANALIEAGEQLLAAMNEQLRRGGGGASGATPESFDALESLLDGLANAAQTIADPPLRLDTEPARQLLRRLLTELKGYQRGEFTAGLQELRVKLDSVRESPLTAVSQPGPMSRLLRQVPEIPTQVEAQQGLREVLGDPTLELLWITIDGAYVTAEGQPTTLMAHTSGRRATTQITHEDRTVGALIHEPSLLADPGLGEVAAVIGLAIEKDNVNQQLRRQRDLLSAIGDGTPALLCLILANGTITPEGSNRATRELVGQTHEDLAGRCFWDVVVMPADRVAVEQVIQRVVAGEAQPERVSRWQTTTGAAAVAWTCTKLPDVASEPVFLISGIDVTERELQAQELRDSRSRIVLAADTERRRLERNLHDGAQQRLVSLALSLRRAESYAGSAPEQAVSILREASRDLTEAISELRELARGLHPVLLTERGLGPAVQALAERAALPVTVRNDLPGRLPESIEAAAYFVVAEALTNAARYAQASAAIVTLEVADDLLKVTVADDGVGGAALGDGSGLRGLADRVEAIAGRLALSSDSTGTRVTAFLPLGA